MSTTTSPRIAVTGATGFVGALLCRALSLAGYEVVQVRRSASPQPTDDPESTAWNPETGEIIDGEWEGLAGLVHLAGESIQGRWTAEKKRKIRESRVDATRKLVDSLLSLSAPPQRIVSCSAIGIYGSQGNQTLTEQAPLGDDFLAEVAVGWEAACDPARAAGLRVVHPRIGIVMHPDGGALAKMLPIFKWGLGGKVGSGEQWWSWISLDDVVKGLVWLVQENNLTGGVNFAAPGAVTNSEFTSVLASVISRPSLFPVPKTAVKLLMGEMGEALLLASTRVEPQRLLENGYSFLDTELEPTLKRLLHRSEA